eukprot:c24596_g1_i1 orf=660-1325(-)
MGGLRKSSQCSFHHVQAETTVLFSLNLSRTANLPAMPEIEVLQDVMACIISLSIAMGTFKLFDELARRDVFQKEVNRKLVHISIGLLFMLCWPLFSYAPVARYVAASVPAVNGLRMLALGFGFVENKSLVKSISRGGDPRDLTRGPFYYALSISITTALFWRTSPVSSAIISNLCAGDGFANVLGRKLGNVKLPYNSIKSYVGSLSMFMMGFLSSVGFWLL